MMGLLRLESQKRERVLPSGSGALDGLRCHDDLSPAENVRPAARGIWLEPIYASVAAFR